MQTLKQTMRLNRTYLMDKEAKIKEAHALLDRVEIIFDSWITQLKAL